MVFVKNQPFSHVCIFEICRHKRSFFDILNRQECFLDKNSKVEKSPKNRKFAKGLVHGF